MAGQRDLGSELNDQVKSLLLAAVFVLPSVRAHGHITSWIINGKHNPGYTPYWPAEQGPTAERPTDNLDEGMSPVWTSFEMYMY